MDKYQKAGSGLNSWIFDHLDCVTAAVWSPVGGWLLTSLNGTEFSCFLKMCSVDFKEARFIFAFLCRSGKTSQIALQWYHSPSFRLEDVLPWRGKSFCYSAQLSLTSMVSVVSGQRDLRSPVAMWMIFLRIFKNLHGGR